MVTYLLIALNVLISLIAFAAMNRASSGKSFFFEPHAVASGKNYAGMVLSHFSHADGGHLLFNMVTLYFFGHTVEFGLGVPYMLLIYGVAAVVSTVVVYFLHRSEPEYRSLGASDSVTAIIFAAIILDPGITIAFILVPVPIPAPIFAVGYIVISMFLMGREGGRTSHEAHLAGAFTGLVLAGFLAVEGFRPLLRTIQFLLS
jgi:membrane associated rhomboid family serine protease